MSNKITALAGAASCAGLVVTFAPGFAREIAATVMPSGKLHAAINDRAAAIDPPDCASYSWPYNCNWHASSERKHVAKRPYKHHHRDVLTSNLSASGNLKQE